MEGDGSGKEGEMKIDWLNHGLEFVVVVFGILLAFQLDKCTKEKKDERMIAAHMEQIYDETKLNMANLEYMISHTDSNIVKLDTVISYVLGKKSTQKVNLLSLNLLNIGGLYLRKNAYTGLVESGDIRLLKTVKQKQEIIDLYEYYKWVESFDKISIESYVRDFYPYLSDNFDLLTGKIQEEEIYFSKKYANVLAAYKHSSMNKLKKYRDCLRKTEEFLEKHGELKSTEN